MRRFITALATGVTLALPAQASAITTGQMTAFIKRGFTNQVRARLQLAGYIFLGDSVKCIYVGQHTWNCYAKYSASKSGYTFQYGVYIVATPNGWKTTGNATLLKES